MIGRHNAYAWPLAVCVALAALVWAGTFLATGQLRRSTEQEAASVRHNLATSLAEHEASSVRAIDISLVALRDVWLRDRPGFERAVAEHEQLLSKERVIQVAVIDADGGLAYSQTAAPKGLRFDDRSYFKAHRNGQGDSLSISEPVVGRVTGQRGIQFTRAIRAPDGAFLGVVLLAVRPPALEQVYREIDLGPGGVITLARTDGQILARSENLDRSVSVSVAPYTQITASGSGEFTGPGLVDGVERFVAFRVIPEYQLVIFVGQGVEAVLGRYQRQRGFLLAFATAATLLLLWVGVLLALRLRDRARYHAEQESMMLELHDGCIQSIYAIGLTLQGTRRLLAESPGRANALIAQAEADLNLVIQDLRAFIGGEKPPRLSAEQLRAEIERSLPKTPETRFEVDLRPEALEALAAEEAAHVLRIIREAAANVARHANATQAFVRLGRGPGGEFELEIADNGRGLGAGATASGLGLAHIEARARKLGGSASITTAGQGGTRVSVHFPGAS
ncbi:MAG TPA: cache domain-containing protein [Usitatibacter sp.]|nr:cache domain-containing protein [Usitatibacter sp.]